MKDIMGLSFSMDKSFGIGIIFDFTPDWPHVLTIIVGPFCIEVNRFQYWKEYFKYKRTINAKSKSES